MFAFWQTCGHFNILSNKSQQKIRLMLDSGCLILEKSVTAEKAEKRAKSTDFEGKSGCSAISIFS